MIVCWQYHKNTNFNTFFLAKKYKNRCFFVGLSIINYLKSYKMTNKTNFNAVDKVIMYSFNYEHKFIENIFNDNLAKHLRAKFSNYCTRFGNSQTAFMYLYTALGNDNKQTLVNYILNK